MTVTERAIADLTKQADLFAEKLSASDRSSGEQRAAIDGMAKQTQVDREAAARDREQLAQVRKELEEERATARQRDRELADARQEIALLRQKLDDHLKRVEVWSGRLWALITVLIGAVLTLASGLIVTLAKK